jgi:hypothetical protein
MTLLEHAKREFDLAGYKQDDEPNSWMMNDVLELIEVFAKQGHSGGSAPYCIELFKTLASHKLLSPLTGKDDEWNDVGNGLYQNKRASHIFKENEQAYNIEGKVFREKNGSCYTNGNSRVNIKFPYTLTDPIYVEIEGE